MEKSKIINDEHYNFNLWYDSYDESFLKINRDSMAPEKWLSFYEVVRREYRDSIIKPINLYVQKLYPPPKLVSINKNTVILRQGNHAEFFLAIEDKQFKNVDRPWIRQYYQTKENPETVDGCFPGSYKFYVPWIIDANVKVSFKPIIDSSPFFVYPKTEYYHKLSLEEGFIEPTMIKFHFKNAGSHMIDQTFGKIKRQSPMYDMVFDLDDILIEKVVEFYEKN